MPPLQGEQFWAQVYSFSQQLEEKAAQGVAVVVEIETFDGEKFTPGTVQRYPPWLICQSGTAEDELAREIIYIREEDIRRVHIRQERSDKPSLGFALGNVKP
jgi:hypothetical protein